MASEIREILSKYTIDTLEILQTKGKGNLLVADPSFSNDSFSANLLEVSWGSIERLGDNKWFPDETTGAKVHFKCDEFVGRQILHSTKILLFDFELERSDEKLKIYHLKPTCNSFITTWYNGATAAHWTLNLCCGGYGGWEYAFQTAHEYGWPFHYHIGLDHMLPAAAQHSINHRTQFVNNVQLGPAFFAERCKSTTICAPIQASGWRQAVSMVNPQIWTFSFPCQSWTGAAWSQGFSDDNGKVLLEGLGLARVMRPAIILLENVKNFSMHQQYSDFCQVVHWCGYRFLHQAVVDAQERTPCVRPRWLAVIERIEESPHPFTWPKWEIKNHNLMTWGCHIRSTPEELLEFVIPPSVVQKYMDVSYLPLHAPYWAKNKVLNYRSVPLQNKLPVVMAAYGRQHELRDDLLRSRGLFGHFTAEECKFRWWKPVELIMAHMQITPMALLQPKEIAWQTIGNCIMQHHALIAVYAAFDHYYGPNHNTLENILLKIEAKRMKPETTKVQKDDFAWYLGSDVEITPIKNYVQVLAKELSWGQSKTVAWPVNHLFEFEAGCIPIDAHRFVEHQQSVSPTLPLSLEPCQDLEDLPQEVNSPLDSPADQIPDTLDYQIQQKFHAAEFKEHVAQFVNTHIQAQSQPEIVQNDEYQIVSDESMQSDSDLECTDESLQHNLMQFLVPNEAKVDDTAHMVTPLLEPGNYSALCVLSPIPTKAITQLWDHRLGLLHAEKYCQVGLQDEAFFTPNELLETGCLMPIAQDSSYVQQMSSQSITEKILIFDIGGQSFAQERNTTTTPDLTRFPAYTCSEWYDEIGQIPLIPMTCNQRIFSEPVEMGKCFDVLGFISAMTRVTYEPRIPLNTDIFVLQFKGSPEDLAQVLTFWQLAIDSPWITKHSRALVRQIVDSNCVQLVFQPRGITFATPITIFRYALENKLLMTFLNSLEGRNGNCELQFKVAFRNLPKFQIAKEVRWEIMLDALQHIYAINEFGLQPSILHAGKRICSGTIEETLNGQDQTHIKFHIARPIIGGTGAKVEHKQAIHAGLSSLFMDHGVNFKQVPDHITTMIQQFGIPRLTVLLFQEEPDKKESAFRELCQQCSINLPIKTGTLAKAKAKFQKLGTDKNIHEMRNLDVTRYQLKPGYFLTMQGKSLPITADFSPCVPSVTMMSAEAAKPWISQSGKLLPDELAIFVVGELDIPNKPMKQLVAPAINMDGQQCLIAGYLLQLGDKQVVVATDEGTLIQTHDVQICSFTMWKQDFHHEEWQEAIKSPVRFSKQLLAKDGLDDVIRSPFGRAFRKDSKPCSPSEATSIQYHSEVKLADLRKLLRRSGFNRLFITPKTTNGKPSDQWRIIWLPQTSQQLEAMCLGQASIAGLIRGRKSQGIRVETSHFPEIWEKFHPGVEPPKKTPQGDVYKIQPLPFGVDREVLQEWADSNSWNMHPLKPLGAKTWLVNSSDAPPKDVMFFNSSPLLITKMQPKNTENPIGLIAGPKSVSAAITVPPVKNPTVFQKGDPFFDPWQGTATSSSVGKVESGPTEKYLQQHDQQIKHLEQAVQELQIMAKDNAKDQDEKFKKIENQMQTQANQTQAVLHSFESSLAQALSQQEAKISSSMDELKQLLLRNDKRPRSSPDDIEED